MEMVFSLCVPRDEASVPIVRHVCRDLLKDLGVGPGCLYDIEVAVSEACTNVLKHASHPDAGYEVKIDVTQERCVISVIDPGGGFDHKAAQFQAAHPTAEAGRGLHLMKALVDDLRFVSEPRVGSIVHLEKTLELTDGALLKKLAP